MRGQFVVHLGGGLVTCEREIVAWQAHSGPIRKEPVTPAAFATQVEVNTSHRTVKHAI